MARPLIWLSALVLTTLLTDVHGQNRVGKSTSYRDVCATVWSYLRAPTNDHTHAIFHRKRVAGGQLQVTDASQAQAGPDAPRTRFELTSIDVYYDGFALVRVDERDVPRTLVLTLFHQNGTWTLVNEVEVGGADAKRNPVFSSATSADEVMQAMATYYEAVEFGRAAPLNALFHPQWHMKNPEDGVLVAEGKAAFLERIDGRPVAGYYEDRQVTDLQILYDTIAVVRVDKPASRSTTLFTLFREQGRWRIIDKAWAVPQPL
ncbi:MAG: nuclear transport factor 2 family protein [Pseudomonadota bacterium]